MSYESVQLDDPCDGCGGRARWQGVKVEPGGATGYVITCLSGSCIPAVAHSSGSKIEPVSVVTPREPAYVPEYIRRFIGRRSA